MLLLFLLQTPEPTPVIDFLEGSPIIPVPTADLEFVAQTTIAFWSTIMERENIIYLIVALLIGLAILGWAIRSIRKPADFEDLID